MRAEQIGAAGVEFRSDTFSSEDIGSLSPAPDKALYSLRSESAVFIPREAQFYDIDVGDLETANLPANGHRIDSAHPTQFGPGQFPFAAKDVKWAPPVSDFGEVRQFCHQATKLREKLLGPILPKAVEKLHEAVKAGEKWAILITIAYSLPKPKPIDIEEMAEFEERLSQLEQVASTH